MPPIPKTGAEYVAQAGQYPEFYPYFQGSAEVNGQTVALLAKPEMLELVNQLGAGAERVSVSFDGTFHTTPRPWKQMFCVFVRIGRHSFAVGHCLMTNRRGPTYDAALDLLFSLLPDVFPSHCMSDWETAR